MKTIKSLAILLGLGLFALWIVGLVGSATSWLTWIVLAGAVAAFFVASVTPLVGTRGSRSSGIFLVSAALFGLWIAALVVHATVWLAWWTFAIACAFLVLGIVAMAVKSAVRAVEGQAEPKQHLRRVG